MVQGGSVTLLVNHTRVDFSVFPYSFISVRPWRRGGNGEVGYDIFVVRTHCGHKFGCG